MEATSRGSASAPAERGTDVKVAWIVTRIAAGGMALFWCPWWMGKAAAMDPHCTSSAPFVVLMGCVYLAGIALAVMGMWDAEDWRVSKPTPEPPVCVHERGAVDLIAIGPLRASVAEMNAANAAMREVNEGASDIVLPEGWTIRIIRHRECD
jgi:hypothetical protein